MGVRFRGLWKIIEIMIDTFISINPRNFKRMKISSYIYGISIIINKQNNEWSVIVTIYMKLHYNCYTISQQALAIVEVQEK